MQTSYEVIKNAITFNKPDRLPVMFELFGINDTHRLGWNQIGTGDGTLKETEDEWHCIWNRSDVTNMGQVKGHPLLEWSNLDLYRWPDGDDPAFFEGMEERFEGSKDKYVMTGIFMLLFERMHSLRGFENVLVDLYLEKEKIEMLADRIVDFNIRIIENIATRFPGQIHGFGFTDDWGTERATFINVALWDEFFKPRYKKMFDLCHEKGWDVWMHSCGKINDIIPSLIDIGLDVINMQQPRTNGIEEIGKRFSGKLCFQSVCDIQHTLPLKSDAEVEQEAVDLMDHWGTEEGGFILSDYGDGAAIGVDDARKKVMYDAFTRHDRWKKQTVAS